YSEPTFSSYCYAHPLDLHSFPTRRSSDLPTVAGLAAALTAETGAGEVVVPLVAGPRPQILPLAPVQRGMWLLNRLDPRSPAHNIPLAVRLTGDLDEDRLARAFAAVLARHESLRTYYPQSEDGTGHKVILAADEHTVRLAVEDVDPAALDTRIA